MTDSGMRLYATTSVFVGVFVCTLLAVLVLTLSRMAPPREGAASACNGVGAPAYACSLRAKRAGSRH